ncbi:hypothetical protein BDR26DRAFT_920447 [Obelidium mucronatum]|nr:hypothetical protein BDR26DRAFT_920447 [Obelidium mucronatum]
MHNHATTLDVLVSVALSEPSCDPHSHSHSPSPVSPWAGSLTPPGSTNFSNVPSLSHIGGVAGASSRMRIGSLVEDILDHEAGLAVLPLGTGGQPSGGGGGGGYFHEPQCYQHQRYEHIPNQPHSNGLFQLDCGRPYLSFAEQQPQHETYSHQPATLSTSSPTLHINQPAPYDTPPSEKLQYEKPRRRQQRSSNSSSYTISNGSSSESPSPLLTNSSVKPSATTTSTKRKNMQVFDCKICGKEFFRKHHIESHMVTHQTDYPFKCQLEGCLSKFRRIQDLRRHLRNVKHASE